LLTKGGEVGVGCRPVSEALGNLDCPATVRVII
jgi:hypothetical protein